MGAWSGSLVSFSLLHQSWIVCDMLTLESGDGVVCCMLLGARSKTTGVVLCMLHLWLELGVPARILITTPDIYANMHGWILMSEFAYHLSRSVFDPK